MFYVNTGCTGSHCYWRCLGACEDAGNPDTYCGSYCAGQCGCTCPCPV